MLSIQRNADGSFKTNRPSHTADILCSCGTTASGVDMNANGSYVDRNGSHVAIALSCAQIGGNCSNTTFWPVSNGTAEAQEMALVKTA